MRISRIHVGKSLVSCLFACLLFVVASSASAIPISYQKQGVPDFGQYVDPSWGNCYCAPTAAANSVWWFSQHGFPLLNQGSTWGNDVGATATINSLGTLMNTSPTTGTTDPNIRNGLAAYLDFFYPNRFDVRLVYATDLGGGAALWDFMRNELYRSEDVLPLVSWNTGGGHAITMTSYFDDPLVLGDERIDINDPATNGGTHNWGGEYLSINILGFAADRIMLAPWASGSGYIDAVVVASPIPEPGTVLLMMWGVGIFFALRLRTRLALQRP